ncbi:MAG: hypothetical protein AWT59_3441, partial [Candidatus Gallionella acididurans]
ELTGLKPDISSEWRTKKCFLVAKGNQFFADECMDTKRPLIFLWGDSQAAALYPGFKEFQSKYLYGIAQYTAAACKPFVGEIAVGDKSCAKFNQSILSTIKKTKPEIVLLHGLWSDANDITQLKITIGVLKSFGIKNIVLIGPDPIWNDELPRIFFTYYRKEHKRPPLRMTENNANAAHAFDMTLREFSRSEDVKYISSLDILCNQDGCLTRPDVNSEDIMSMDQRHLSPQGAIYLARFILMDLIKSDQPANDSSHRAIITQ